MSMKSLPVRDLDMVRTMSPIGAYPPCSSKDRYRTSSIRLAASAAALSASFFAFFSSFLRSFSALRSSLAALMAAFSSSVFSAGSADMNRRVTDAPPIEEAEEAILDP